MFRHCRALTVADHQRLQIKRESTRLLIKYGQRYFTTENLTQVAEANSLIYIRQLKRETILIEFRHDGLRVETNDMPLWSRLLKA